MLGMKYSSSSMISIDSSSSINCSSNSGSGNSSTSLLFHLIDVIEESARVLF